MDTVQNGSDSFVVVGPGLPTHASAWWEGRSLLAGDERRGPCEKAPVSRHSSDQSEKKRRSWRVGPRQASYLERRPPGRRDQRHARRAALSRAEPIPHALASVFPSREGCPTGGVCSSRLEFPTHLGRLLKVLLVAGRYGQVNPGERNQSRTRSRPCSPLERGSQRAGCAQYRARSGVAGAEPRRGFPATQPSGASPPRRRSFCNVKWIWELKRSFGKAAAEVALLIANVRDDRVARVFQPLAFASLEYLGSPLPFGRLAD